MHPFKNQSRAIKYTQLKRFQSLLLYLFSSAQTILEKEIGLIEVEFSEEELYAFPADNLLEVQQELYVSVLFELFSG